MGYSGGQGIPMLFHPLIGAGGTGYDAPKKRRGGGADRSLSDGNHAGHFHPTQPADMSLFKTSVGPGKVPWENAKGVASGRGDVVNTHTPCSPAPPSSATPTASASPTPVT